MAAKEKRSAVVPKTASARNIDMEKVGARVLRACVAREWSQQQLADAAGMDKATVSLFVRGKRIEISMVMVARIVDVLWLNWDWMLYGDGEPYRRRRRPAAAGEFRDVESPKKR